MRPMYVDDAFALGPRSSPFLRTEMAMDGPSGRRSDMRADVVEATLTALESFLAVVKTLDREAIEADESLVDTRNPDVLLDWMVHAVQCEENCEVLLSRIMTCDRYLN